MWKRMSSNNNQTDPPSVVKRKISRENAIGGDCKSSMLNNNLTPNSLPPPPPPPTSASIMAPNSMPTLNGSSPPSVNNSNTQSPSTMLPSIIDLTDNLRLVGKPVQTYSTTNDDDNKPPYRPRPETCQSVWLEFQAKKLLSIDDALACQLAEASFDNWSHSDAELMTYVRYFFTSLNLTEACSIPLDVLDSWLIVAYQHYNLVPFHNFKHVFMVTQMMYVLIRQGNLAHYLPPLDLFALLFSALSHDLDHPGFTNSYQVNVGSWLALRYNDASPLENHHCAMAFQLINASPSTDVTCGLTKSQKASFRQTVIKCIMSTDMAYHKDCLVELRQRFADLLTPSIPNAPASSLEQLLAAEEGSNDRRLILLACLLKLCDVSNELRPLSSADRWLDCLLDEFFFQARCEKQSNLPVAPIMDPDKLNRSSSQLGFLSGVISPLINDLSSIVPGLLPLRQIASDRVAHYKQMTSLIENTSSISSTNNQSIPASLGQPSPSLANGSGVPEDNTMTNIKAVTLIEHEKAMSNHPGVGVTKNTTVEIDEQQQRLSPSPPRRPRVSIGSFWPIDYTANSMVSRVARDSSPGDSTISKHPQRRFSASHCRTVGVDASSTPFVVTTGTGHNSPPQQLQQQVEVASNS